MAANDWNGDGRSDMAASAIYETFGPPSYPGAANVLYGAAGGLSAAGNQLWTQDSPGIQDRSESDDFFGHAMA